MLVTVPSCTSSSSSLRFIGYLEAGKTRQRFLCGSFSEQGITTTTYYLRTLMQVAGARLANLTLLVEFERSFKLREFVDRNLEYRRLHTQ
jgi:transposase-like protein